MNQAEPADALAAAYRVLLCRFSPGEADRLVALKRRAERGDFRELTDADRLTFARWLVARERLTEWPAEHRAPPPRPSARGYRTDATGASAGRSWWHRRIGLRGPRAL